MIVSKGSSVKRNDKYISKRLIDIQQRTFFTVEIILEERCLSDTLWHVHTSKTVNGVEKYKWVQSAIKWQKNLETQQHKFSLQNIEV